VARKYLLILECIVGKTRVRNVDFSGISAVVVTHNHPDHLNEAFVEAVNQSSPNAKWYGTQETATTLKTLGITGLLSSQDEDIQYIESAHADLSPWFDEQPQHTSYVVFGEMLISGDCQTLASAHGARILAAAVNGGPWGAVVGFTKMIESMSDRPEVVIPLHDWHWNEAARSAIYARLSVVLAMFDVELIQTADRDSQEV
jgi:L-ascorbate metabolism protein UlaG (beta-lactamase superfamily)